MASLVYFLVVLSCYGVLQMAGVADSCLAGLTGTDPTSATYLKARVSEPFVRITRPFARCKNRLRVSSARQHFVVFNMLLRHLCQRGVACRGPDCLRVSFVGWRRTCGGLVPKKSRCCCVSCHGHPLGRVSMFEVK